MNFLLQSANHLYCIKSGLLRLLANIPVLVTIFSYRCQSFNVVSDKHILYLSVSFVPLEMPDTKTHDIFCTYSHLFKDEQL